MVYTKCCRNWRKEIPLIHSVVELQNLVAEFEGKKIPPIVKLQNLVAEI